MKENKKLYIEILASAYNTSGFVNRTLPQYVFEGYLELIGEKDEFIEKLKQKYTGTSETQFSIHIDLQSRHDEYEIKVSSLESLLNDIAPEEFDELNLDEKQYSAINAAYKSYQFKTGHKKKAPAKIFQLKSPVINKLHDIIKQIGRDVLELHVLFKVKNQVTLTGIYQPLNTNSNIIIVDMVADACWDLYQNDNKIGRKELCERVINEYHIEHYNDLAPTKYKKRVLKTVKQWVRDNEEKLQIK